MSAQIECQPGNNALTIPGCQMADVQLPRPASRPSKGMKSGLRNDTVAFPSPDGVQEMEGYTFDLR